MEWHTADRAQPPIPNSKEDSITWDVDLAAQVTNDLETKPSLPRMVNDILIWILLTNWNAVGNSQRAHSTSREKYL